MRSRRVYFIIPALNEEQSVAKVIEAIPAGLATGIIVADNGSTDNTALVSAKAGATVVSEPQRGYGAACLKAIDFLNKLQLENQPDVVVFLDADFSDYPEESSLLLEMIDKGEADLVIGSRTKGNREKGSLTPQQVFGNFLATTIINLRWKTNYSDLGPFRAIRWEALRQLNMQDKNYGWTVEMQIKAAKLGLRISEVPVRYRNRIGNSKISGTLKGSVLAGYKILKTIWKYS